MEELKKEIFKIIKHKLKEIKQREIDISKELGDMNCVAAGMACGGMDVCTEMIEFIDELGSPS